MAFDYGKHFGEMKVLHDLMTTPDERRWRLSAPERDPEPHAIVLYLGCNVLRTSHMIRTVTALFDHLGLDYVAVGGVTYCCGIVHHRNGDTAAGESMSHHTIELFKKYRPDDVVMWCPSCIHFYDDILQQRLPFRVWHTTEFLADQLPRLQFTTSSARRGSVKAPRAAACSRHCRAWSTSTSSRRWTSIARVVPPYPRSSVPTAGMRSSATSSGARRPRAPRRWRRSITGASA